MTSLCPDRCGHAKDTAVFKTVEYEDFQKNSQYGEKQDVYHADMNPNANTDKQEERFIELIKSLQPGQKVRLHWDHIYVTNQGSKYPERPIRELEVL
ncbi:Tvp14 [Tritrichomonas foetus]|uniref:Tvp14 n=1 Tax=Tritrichomonas foetus TaxID=1144522 RepID=A0A1J4JH26_9EUKA|nr:Tvp14 [Tritrichomonas foetus]|eukprot:OHS98001.1 Tvp14 [Tritrichomonas foetus]